MNIHAVFGAISGAAAAASGPPTAGVAGAPRPTGSAMTNSFVTIKPIDSPYGYTPDLGASIAFLVVFSILTAIHLLLAIRYKYWTAIATMVVGGILEIIGWSGRVWSHINVLLWDNFIIQIVCIIIAPVFFSAWMYIVLSMAIQRLGGQYSLIGHQLYIIIFIIADIVSIVIQAVGGGRAAVDAQRFADTRSSTHVMLAGILFQVGTTGIFTILGFDFMIRCVLDKPYPAWWKNLFKSRGTDRKLKRWFNRRGDRKWRVFQWRYDVQAHRGRDQNEWRTVNSRTRTTTTTRPSVDSAAPINASQPIDPRISFITHARSSESSGGSRDLPNRSSMGSAEPVLPASTTTAADPRPSPEPPIQTQTLGEKPQPRRNRSYRNTFGFRDKRPGGTPGAGGTPEPESGRSTRRSLRNTYGSGRGEKEAEADAPTHTVVPVSSPSPSPRPPPPPLPPPPPQPESIDSAPPPGPLDGPHLSPPASVTSWITKLRRTEFLFFGVTIASLMIYMRGIYRAVELAGGWHSSLVTTERYFWWLDGFAMVVLMTSVAVAHPGFLLPPRTWGRRHRSWHEFDDEEHREVSDSESGSASEFFSGDVGAVPPVREHVGEKTDRNSVGRTLPATSLSQYTPLTPFSHSQLRVFPHPPDMRPGEQQIARGQLPTSS